MKFTAKVLIGVIAALVLTDAIIVCIALSM
jgi:hypothetical protein